MKVGSCNSIIYLNKSACFCLNNIRLMISFTLTQKTISSERCWSALAVVYTTMKLILNNMNRIQIQHIVQDV